MADCWSMFKRVFEYHPICYYYGALFPDFLTAECMVGSCIRANNSDLGGKDTQIEAF